MTVSRNLYSELKYKSLRKWLCRNYRKATVDFFIRLIAYYSIGSNGRWLSVCARFLPQMLMRRTELSLTTKLSAEQETQPITNVCYKLFLIVLMYSLAICFILE